MRIVSVLSLVAVLAAGCATERQVAQKQGHGTTRVYAAGFNQAWPAAVDAAQQNGLEVFTADRASGYLSARRSIRPHTFGENVGVWVRELSPGRTQVEVVSRQAGPPVAWLKNWENEIHRAIAANLTRGTAVGGAPRDVIIDRGDDSRTVVVPEKRETVIIPETPTTTGTTVTERQRIQREIERTREDLRLQEQRLRDLERQLDQQ